MCTRTDLSSKQSWARLEASPSFLKYPILISLGTHSSKAIKILKPLICNLINSKIFSKIRLWI
jgi:hypothetical protein